MLIPPRKPVAAAALSALLCAAFTAVAEPPPPPNPEGTRERLEQHAREAKQTNEPAEHLDVMRALARLPNADTETFCALGVRARRRQEYVVAARALERCLAAFRLVPLTPHTPERDRVDHLWGELEIARAHVGSLTVTAPKGAKLTIDGSPEAPGSVVYVEADQQHHVAIERGHERAEVDVRMRPGTARELSLSFPSPPPPPPPSPRPRAIDAAVIPGFVSAAAFALASGVLFGVAAAKRNEAEESERLAMAVHPRACVRSTNVPELCTGYVAASRDAASMKKAAIGAAIAGGVTLGLTLTITFSAPKSAPPVRVGGTRWGIQ